MAVAGDDLFVADYDNGTGDSVIELNASTGTLVRVISGPEYKIGGPYAIAVAGDDLVVANATDNSLLTDNAWLTEINVSTGALVRVISGPKYNLASPVAFPPASVVVVAGDDLFVANRPESGGGSVTEINVSTGALVRVASGRAYRLSNPIAMAVVGGNLFVANGRGNSVTELDASTGALVRVVTGGAYKFSGPFGMAVAGDDLFVTDYGVEPDVEGNSVTELDASTGALVRVVSGPAYQFNCPVAVAVAGEDLFVANADGSSVTELPM
jgi:outer membrane protein assembly factor BamB